MGFSRILKSSGRERFSAQKLLFLEPRERIKEGVKAWYAREGEKTEGGGTENVSPLGSETTLSRESIVGGATCRIERVREV